MKVRFCSVRNRYLLTSARFSMSFDISCHRHENVFRQFLISLGLRSRMVSNQPTKKTDSRIFMLIFPKGAHVKFYRFLIGFGRFTCPSFSCQKILTSNFAVLFLVQRWKKRQHFDSISIFQIIKLYRKLWVALNLLVSCFTDYLTAFKPRPSHHIRVIDILVKPRRTVFCSLLHKRTSKLKFCLPYSKLS